MDYAPGTNVETLLRNLQSGKNAITRVEAAVALGKLTESNAPVVGALVAAKENDEDEYVRKAAATALLAPVHQAVSTGNPDLVANVALEIRKRYKSVQALNTLGEPRDPSRLISLSYFLTTIGAGYLLSENWKRLGKPEWSEKTLIWSIVAGVTAIGIIVGAIALLSGSRNQFRLLFPAVGLGFGINFGFMYALWYLQRPAYKKWKNKGRAAMLAHTYKIQQAQIFFVGFVVLATVGFGLFGMTR